MVVYYNGSFLPKQEVGISPDDRGFLFGDGVYEVVPAYRGKLFRAREHFQRLSRSLGVVRIDGPLVDGLPGVAAELIEANGLDQADALVYIQVTRGVAPRRHAFPADPTAPTVYASAKPFQRRTDDCRRGVKAILVSDIRWGRCDIKAVSLLPNVLASQEAREHGAEEAVLVRDGFVTEGARSNVCAVLDGALVTHPEGRHILSGITRQLVLELCPGLAVPVREAPIAVDELDRVDELMLVGSSVEVMPVTQLGDRPVANAKPGPVTTRLQDALWQVIAQPAPR